MLNLELLHQTLNQLKSQLLLNYEAIQTLAKFFTPTFLANEALQQMLLESAQKLEFFSWKDHFGPVHAAPHTRQAYKVLAVDGSQINPDRHQGFAEFGLVQVAGALFNYGLEQSFTSYSCAQELVQVSSYSQQDFLPSVVEVVRNIIELEQAVLWAHQLKPDLILFDGSLNFLLLQQERLVGQLGQRLSQALKQLQQLEIPWVFYTAMPGSNNYAQLLKLQFCKAPYFEKLNCYGACKQPECKMFANANDSKIWQALLPAAHSSQLFFKNTEFGKLNELFVNTNCAVKSFWTGEIVRVEFFADQVDLNGLLAMIFDQTNKGFGYPVALTHAHHRAIISFVEQQLFLQLLERSLGIEKLQESCKAVYKNIIPL